MAGVDVGGDVGRRRSLSLEINMVPMIDLLMVTISFLLITAVWTHMSRLNADANVPHPCEGESCDKPPAETKTLHVDMRDETRFVLTWKRGDAVVDRIEVPKKRLLATSRDDRSVRYPDLAAKLGDTWSASGDHRASSDHMRDRAVLHADDNASYSDLVAVMDAIHSVQRPVDEDGRTEKEPAFDLVFAMK